MSGSPARQSSSLSDWWLQSGWEPIIRVGICLPEDQIDSVTFRAPAGLWRTQVGGTETPFGPGPVHVHASEGGVSLRVDAGETARADLVRFRPEQPVPLERGAGLQLLGIVAGRGFHWQKRIDPTFCGTFECRAVGSRLLVVNELPLEDYLAGVIAAEMSGDCPLEFLRSQCIVARAWVLAHTEDKHSELGFDRCNDDCCQRYQGTMDITPAVVEAVHSTRGQVVVDERLQIIDANYSKSCGGIIESPEHVWGLRKAGQRPALDAPPESRAGRFFPLRESHLEEFLTGQWFAETDIFCSPHVVPEQDLPRYLGKVDDGGGHFRWQIRYTRDELEEILRRKFFSKQSADPLATLTDLAVVARGDSGRAKQMRISYLDTSGRARSVDVHTEYNIRDVLHASFLYSSAFLVRIERDEGGLPSRIELIGAGWGHGAGLCQIGALGMALRDYSAEQILNHYFSPIRIHTCY